MPASRRPRVRPPAPQKKSIALSMPDSTLLSAWTIQDNTTREDLKTGPDTRPIERWLPIVEIGIESTCERTPRTPFPAPNRLHV